MLTGCPMPHPAPWSLILLLISLHECMYAYATDVAHTEDSLPYGAILPLMEMTMDGVLTTVGTLVVISRSGQSVTASHCAIR